MGTNLKENVGLWCEVARRRRRKAKPGGWIIGPLKLSIVWEEYATWLPPVGMIGGWCCCEAKASANLLQPHVSRTLPFFVLCMQYQYICLHIISTAAITCDFVANEDLPLILCNSKHHHHHCCQQQP
jgi:hypothetical protein